MQNPKVEHCHLTAGFVFFYKIAVVVACFKGLLSRNFDKHVRYHSNTRCFRMILVNKNGKKCEHCASPSLL